MLEKINSFDPETLATPEVKPAADAVNALGELAGNLVATTKEIQANPDLSDKGKEKLEAQGRKAFLSESAKLSGQVDTAIRTQRENLDSLIAAARNADKPAELGADASLEATLAMERMKSMTAADFVADYQAAVANGDYITRRTAEAVSGAILKPGTPEHARFTSIKARVDNPSSPAIQAARNSLETLVKLQYLFGYVAEQTARKGEIPFSR